MFALRNAKRSKPVTGSPSSNSFDGWLNIGSRSVSEAVWGGGGDGRGGGPVAGEFRGEQ